MRNFLVKFISTFFYVGYFPFASGTFASIAGICLFSLIGRSIYTQVAVATLLIILGLVTSGRAERVFGKKDPSCIVIDEVAGVFLSVLFLPYNLRSLVLALLVFRLLDIIKPYPADRFQAKSGSIGIMGDDIVAGIYTNIILQAVFRLAVFNTS